jgi:hypothetical protein
LSKIDGALLDFAIYSIADFCLFVKSLRNILRDKYGPVLPLLCADAGTAGTRQPPASNG